jgi:hypothetical protein
MKKFFALVGLFLFLILLSPPPQVQAATNRYAVCDLCGFCISPTPDAGGPPPYDPPRPDWEKCRACLYPAATANNPGSFSTLEIDDTTNAAPTPALGHHYTMIGCISTNTTDFTKPGAVGVVIQPILNILFTISGGLAFLYLIYGAFIIISSQAEPERISKGKQIIWGSVIGLIFVLMSAFIVNLVGAGILKLPGFGT